MVQRSCGSLLTSVSHNPFQSITSSCAGQSSRRDLTYAQILTRKKDNFFEMLCIQEDKTNKNFKMMNRNIINCWSLRLLSSFQCCETIKMIVILKSVCLRIACHHNNLFSKIYLIFSDIKDNFRYAVNSYF